jgi:hypothetical protein
MVGSQRCVIVSRHADPVLMAKPEIIGRLGITLFGRRSKQCRRRYRVCGQFGAAREQLPQQQLCAGVVLPRCGLQPVTRLHHRRLSADAAAIKISEYALRVRIAILGRLAPMREGASKLGFSGAFAHLHPGKHRQRAGMTLCSGLLIPDRGRLAVDPDAPSCAQLVAKPGLSEAVAAFRRPSEPAQGQAFVLRDVTPFELHQSPDRLRSRVAAPRRCFEEGQDALGRGRGLTAVFEPLRQAACCGRAAEIGRLFEPVCSGHGIGDGADPLATEIVERPGSRLTAFGRRFLEQRRAFFFVNRNPSAADVEEGEVAFGVKIAVLRRLRVPIGCDGEILGDIDALGVEDA